MTNPQTVRETDGLPDYPSGWERGFSLGVRLGACLGGLGSAVCMLALLALAWWLGDAAK